MPINRKTTHVLPSYNISLYKQGWAFLKVISDNDAYDDYTQLRPKASGLKSHEFEKDAVDFIIHL